MKHFFMKIHIKTENINKENWGISKIQFNFEKDECYKTVIKNGYSKDGK
jgi:hypothetical protein